MQQAIETINLPKSKLENLRKSGQYFCDDLTEASLKTLSISSPKPQSNKNTTTSLELLEEELLNGCILTYNTELDKVLSDEIVPKRITELAGFPGTGKTQICFQLCIATQLPKSLGGLEGKVIYINTNKNFSSNRVRELTRNFIKQISKVSKNNLSEEEILKNILVFNNPNVFEIFATVKYLKVFLKDKMVKLLIIDSIASPLRDIELSERTYLTYQLLEELQELATAFDFAIVVTNEFTTRVRDSEAFNTPSLGDSFFDRVNSRICLSRHSEKNFYVAELTKSPVKDLVKASFCMFE
ncbi:unnamed protein product [Ceutorhynchus assimilis]|uniref:DNA repair protein RAD51 homolog 3 n=1 Tax=Ceutorhynchus assimilis TaxID=467358 RepID=A0A9P0DL16_9CUCU|nr:unnamed protein product [Ceutorhynchus assimilis]